ncbi:hypothetical protein CEXT_813831 [Caerostris extrusa]|uniref:Ycf15 n=1 Tax=Caerostris extrusa TaxID=172846 RepID=A0AAV4VW12_CAEEX|nr:hypothetical protein CEXT_813831 [Caerostris extrusa]
MLIIIIFCEIFSFRPRISAIPLVASELYFLFILQPSISFDVRRDSKFEKPISGRIQPDAISMWGRYGPPSSSPHPELISWDQDPEPDSHHGFTLVSRMIR